MADNIEVMRQALDALLWENTGDEVTVAAIASLRAALAPAVAQQQQFSVAWMKVPVGGGIETMHRLAALNLPAGEYELFAAPPSPSPQAEVRMLAPEEVKQSTGCTADWASDALQRKFAEVNGLRIAAGEQGGKT